MRPEKSDHHICPMVELTKCCIGYGNDLDVEQVIKIVDA